MPKRTYINTKPMTAPDKYQKNFLQKLDRRSKVHAALSTSYDSVMDDLGGSDSLSHVQLCLVERFVFLEYVMQTLEQRIAREPDKADELLGRWIQAINSLSGLAKTVGLERRAKTIESLQSYVKTKKTKKVVKKVKRRKHA